MNYPGTSSTTLRTPFDQTIVWGKGHTEPARPFDTNNGMPNTKGVGDTSTPTPTWTDWAKGHIADIAIIAICLAIIVIFIFLAVRNWMKGKEGEFQIVNPSANNTTVTNGVSSIKIPILD